MSYSTHPTRRRPIEPTTESLARCTCLRNVICPRHHAESYSFLVAAHRGKHRAAVA